MSRPATLPELQARYGARYRWLLLLAVMVGSVAAIMSSTIVNVAVPGMSRHFAIGQERVQWVTSGFMVAMTVSMLTTPWLLGRYGYRRTYAGTMWLLLAGGILGGFSTDFSLVLLARVAEGLAAGVVQPIPAIIIMRAFEPHERGRAMGVFGTGSVLAPALGPKTPMARPRSCGSKARMMMIAGIGCTTPAARPSATRASNTTEKSVANPPNMPPASNNHMVPA